MADKIAYQLDNGNDSYRFRSQFYKRIEIPSNAGENVYIKIGGISTSNGSSERELTLLCSMRFSRYLIKIAPNYIDANSGDTERAVNVIRLGYNTAYWCYVRDCKFMISSFSQAGTMEVWLKLFIDGERTPFELVDLSGNVDYPLTCELMGNDFTEYQDTTLEEWYSDNGDYGFLSNNQSEEINPAINIGGVNRKTVYSALSGLNSAKLDTSDACSDKFSATKLYQIGDYTIYNNDLYECSYQHYGSWNASHFKKTTIATALQGHLKPFKTGTQYRIISQDDPSASNAGNGYYEINLQFTANLSASSWTDVTITMTNGVFNWFTPEMDEYLDITVGSISAFVGWDNKPILAHVKSAMNQANKFNVAVKALDSADEGSNVTCFIHFTAYIYQTD